MKSSSKSQKFIFKQAMLENKKFINFSDKASQGDSICEGMSAKFSPQKTQ